MTVPTQPVTIKLADFGGPSVAGVVVTARASDVDYTADNVFVGTKAVTGTTDVNGQVILQLFPNATVANGGLGTVGTTVRVTAKMPGSRGLDVLAAIPNAPCNLVDYIISNEPLGLSGSEAAAARAEAARDIAEADATQTTSDRTQTGLDRAQTTADRVQTGLDRVQTGLDRAAAGTSATNAAGSEAAAAAHAQTSATAAKFFDTIALGLAGVADTQTFGVKAGGSDNLPYPTLYRRNSAATYTLLYRVLTDGALQAADALNKEFASEAGALNWLLSKPFGAGDKGFTFDVAAANSVFTDAAATTPVGASGATARALKLNYPGAATGSSNFVQAGAAALAPTYTEDGATKFLRFDGTQQFMSAANIDLTGCTKATLVVALRQNIFGATPGIVMEHGTSATGTGLAAVINNTVPNGSFGGVAGSPTGFVANNGPTASGAERSLVGTIVFNPSGATGDDKVRIRINGVEVDEVLAATGGAALTADMFALQTMFLGARNGASLFAKMDLYAGMLIGRELTASELVGVEDTLRMRLGEAHRLTPVAFSDCGPVIDRTQYLETNTFASVEMLTDATTLHVTAFTSMTAFADLPAIGVYVNGVYNQQIEYSTAGYNIDTIALPTGEKLVALVNGPQSGPTGAPQLGTFLVSVAADRPMKQVFPQRRRILFYGDSISVGQSSAPVMQKAWVMQLRAAGHPIGVSLEGWGHRGLYDDANTATLRKAFVKKLLSYKPDAIGLAIGTNDYGLDKQNALNFGSQYAAVLDDLNWQAPGMRIFCMTPLVRASEVANTFGDTLGDYRTKIANAVSVRTSYCTLVDGAAILTAADLSDGIHPTTAGHTKIADYWKANVLNW